MVADFDTNSDSAVAAATGVFAVPSGREDG